MTVYIVLNPSVAKCAIKTISEYNKLLNRAVIYGDVIAKAVKSSN